MYLGTKKLAAFNAFNREILNIFVLEENLTDFIKAYW